jgi:hypothetical protein
MIGLSHFWCVLMVCEGWIQHTVNYHYIDYRDVDMLSLIDDALRASPVPHGK